MDILVQPDDYMAGYSAIPIRITDSASTITEQFKYVINILWDKLQIDSITFTTQSILGFTSVHNFKKGDTVFIQDSNDPSYSGYYIISQVPSSTQISINEYLNLGISSAFISKVIKYRLRPDLEGEAKIDLGNTIKDFLTQNLEDVNEVYEAPNTVFGYDLSIGTEQKAIYYFEDNLFVSGAKVGFLNTEITDPNDVTLNIGDPVFIQQNEDVWNYYDNFFNTGNVGFTSTTETHNFRTGTTVNVRGQITNPSYNGFKLVTSVPDSSSIVTNQPWIVGTPVEGGVITGMARPEYNGNSTILDIYYEPLLSGVVVVTDKTFTDASGPIGGYIRSLNIEESSEFDVETINDKKAYNARFTNLEYSVDAFNEYVVKPITIPNPVEDNNISTILRGTYRHRIEQSTKSWLLVHKEEIGPQYDGEPFFDFYNTSGTLLLKCKLTGSTSMYDYHYPVGIDQLINSTSLVTITGSSLTGITNDISYYRTYLGDSLNLPITNTIFFELNDDCSKFDIYHLMWKDKLGSWLSYPFIYLSRDSTEVERKTYYQTEGNWEDNTFGYDSYGRGEKNYFSRSRDKITLNSGWLEDQEVFLMKDLMKSSSVYVQTPDNVLIACMIEENQIQLKKSINDQIFNYTFNIRLSGNDIRL
jgi:hypothetical protein